MGRGAIFEVEGHIVIALRIRNFFEKRYLYRSLEITLPRSSKLHLNILYFGNFS